MAHLSGTHRAEFTCPASFACATGRAGILAGTTRRVLAADYTVRPLAAAAGLGLL
jgi:hypothetical protein